MPKNVPLTDETKALIATEYAELKVQGMSSKDAEDVLCVKLGLGARTIRNYRNYGSYSNSPESLTSSDFELPEPKILLVDVETSYNIGFCWNKYEQNIIEYDALAPNGGEWYLLSWSVRWLNDTPVTKCLADYDGYDPKTGDDKELVLELHRWLQDADIVVWQNGDKFDYRKINTRFLEHRIPPPRPYRTVDTLKIARKHFGFNSNKLDDIGRRLGVGRKLEHQGFPLWRLCVAGDMDAWEIMKRYNENDVALLQDVYLELLPWIFNHPPVSTLKGLIDACRNCGATDIKQEGFILTATGRRPQYQCAYCDTWMTGKHQAINSLR